MALPSSLNYYLGENIQWTHPSLLLFLCSSSFNPLFWNTAARLEYHYSILTRYLGFGNRYRGCYVLALTIFTLGLLRDYLFKQALESQPTSVWLQSEYTRPLAIFLFAIGNTLVLSSMYKLGVTGTYLGDYFGILMKERVISFPFNIMENPMYNGSTLVFAATALWYRSGLGLVLTVWVYSLYQLALVFESSFTAKIYANAKKHSGSPRRSSPRRKASKKDH